MLNIEKFLNEVELLSGNDTSYEPLNGGLSNMSYKITSGGKSYVLRINGRQNDFLGLNRAEEANAIRKAHALGISAEVFYVDDEILITEFKPGKILSEAEIHNPLYIQKAADLLRTAHSIKDIDRHCSPFELMDKYFSGARKLGAVFPDGLDDYLRKMEAIERRASRNSPFTNGYCHNDAYCINILNNDGELCLIDWELSGYGNIFFDIATISFINSFSKAEDKLLLQRYFGQFEDEFTEMLRDMKYMNMMREIGWALLHSAIEGHHIDFDYYKSAVYHFNKLKKGLYQ
jgi:thiamine kinase-like enzyme